MVNTWVKWNIFGAESKQPVYIFVVGELAPESGQILCTAVNGYSFYVSQRFVDRLLPCTDEEQARLASKISQAVVLDNNEQPKNGGGRSTTPSVAYSYTEHFKGA